MPNSILLFVSLIFTSYFHPLIVYQGFQQLRVYCKCCQVVNYFITLWKERISLYLHTNCLGRHTIEQYNLLTFLFVCVCCKCHLSGRSYSRDQPQLNCCSTSETYYGVDTLDSKIPSHNHLHTWMQTRINLLIDYPYVYSLSPVVGGVLPSPLRSPKSTVKIQHLFFDFLKL